MNTRTAAFRLCTLLALAHPPGLAAEEVASVLGVAIDRSELAVAEGGPPAQAGRLYDLVWPRLVRHYIEQTGLAATEAEVAEAAAYHREFQIKDRAQRARKLADLDQRLAADSLDPGQRAWLKEFRGVLARLAERDAEDDRLPPPDPARVDGWLAPWIEMWKMNRELYRKYGGVVALTPLGQYPHGARLALIEDYERWGWLQFADPELRAALAALLAARPSIVVAPDQVDFTPYWKRPIPPSYFPDEGPRQGEKRDP